MVLGQFTKSPMSSGRGGGIVGGEVWQSSGSVAGCCCLDGCDLLVYVCLNSWASSCMGCKKVVLSRLICPMFC